MDEVTTSSLSCQLEHHYEDIFQQVEFEEAIIKTDRREIFSRNSYRNFVRSSVRLHP